MTSNLFGKLSAGVAGVALMAIGVVSTPVQAAIIGLNFFDRDTNAGIGNPFPFQGSLSWDSSKSGIQSISALNFSSRSLSGGLSNVTGVSYGANNFGGNSLKVNLGIGADNFQLSFDGLSQNGDASPSVTPIITTTPYVDTLPGGSLSINNTTHPQSGRLRYTTTVPTNPTNPAKGRTQVQFQTSHNVDGQSLSFEFVFDRMQDGEIANWFLKVPSPYRIRSTRPSSQSSGSQLALNVYVDVLKSLSPTGSELDLVESNTLRFIFENFSVGLSQTGRIYSDKGYVIRQDGKPNNWSDFTYSAYYVPIPEPSTYVGTILAFGALGAVKVLKRKQKNKENFIP